MKLPIFIIFLIAMAGCTSPQAPAPTGPTILGLSIPDTINFGIGRAGVAKDSNVVFKNTGPDTIYITSQSFSDSVFKLSNSSQSKLSIAPGASQMVSFQFLPRDTSPVLGCDTIRTATKTNILVLRGGAVPFVSLAVLSIPDTINFGAVRAGVAKDSNIVFKNTGTDTLKITSQRFSNSAFTLSNASQSQMSIAPGATQTVGIQFLPSDTSSDLGYDTIRTAYKTYILVLRGEGIPFSSFFPSASISINVKLTGLIGNDSVTGSTIYNFDFGAALISQSWEDTLQFSYYYVDASDSSSAPNEWNNTTSYNIMVHIDTTKDEITWLKASYDHQTSSWSIAPGNMGSYQSSNQEEELVLSSIPLTKSANGWSAQEKGPILPSLVISAQYIQQVTRPLDQGGGTGTTQLGTIAGYDPTAVLTITIQ